MAIGTGAALVLGGSGMPLVVEGLATTWLVVSPGRVLAAATKDTATVTDWPTPSGPTLAQFSVPSSSLSADTGTAPA